MIRIHYKALDLMLLYFFPYMKRIFSAYTKIKGALLKKNRYKINIIKAISSNKTHHLHFPLQVFIIYAEF